MGTAFFALTPCWALLAAVLAHVFVSRAAPGIARHYGLIVGVSVGLGTVAALGITFIREPVTASMPAADRWGAAASWALTYLALAYFYVFGVFNPGESARRIRLLVELETAGARGLTLTELFAAYSAREIIEARLSRLVTGGQVVERDGRYVTRRSPMLLTAKILVGLKVLFFGARSEFGPSAGRAGGDLSGH